MEIEPSRRIPALEARLRMMQPTVIVGEVRLYVGNDGLCVVSYQPGNEPITYLGINQDGRIVDLRGYPVDRADITVVMNCLRAARLNDLAGKVSSWPSRQRRG